MWASYAVVLRVMEDRGSAGFLGRLSEPKRREQRMTGLSFLECIHCLSLVIGFQRNVGEEAVAEDNLEDIEMPNSWQTTQAASGAVFINAVSLLRMRN